MKIGELSRETGTAIETIRYYERELLLRAPQRTGGNFRVYEKEVVERLAFIRHCRSLDMTLDEVRVLLDYRDAPKRSCSEVNELLDEHIKQVADRIEELRGLEKQLKTLREQCGNTRSGVNCGILRGISSAARSPRKETSRSR